MPQETESGIYRLSIICAFLVAVSFIVPRYVSNPEGGFAAGASAILVLFVMLGVTLLLSFVLLGITVQRYRSLSMTVRIAGICPSVVLAATLLGLFGFLGY